MARSNSATIPAAPRKTLLEWIEHDDGATTCFSQPRCSVQMQALHARILLGPIDKGETEERLQSPSGLRLAPLG